MEMLNLPEQKNPTGEQQMEELLRKQQVDIMFHPTTTVFEPANEIFEPASTVFEPASDIFEPVNSEYGFQYLKRSKKIKQAFVFIALTNRSGYSNGNFDI